MSESIIAARGNDCAVWPRHLPKTEDELRHTPELWKAIGYRDTVVWSEKISCTGCKADNWCRYGIIGCVSARGLNNCGECAEYPCGNITECFAATEKFAPSCKSACTEEEYETLRKAFFEKKKNLDLIHREITEKGDT